MVALRQRRLKMKTYKYMAIMYPTEHMGDLPCQPYVIRSNNLERILKIIPRWTAWSLYGIYCDGQIVSKVKGPRMGYFT